MGDAYYADRAPRALDADGGISSWGLCSADGCSKSFGHKPPHGPAPDLLALCSPWGLGEFVALAESPAEVRERVARADGEILREFTIEGFVGSTVEGDARSLRFTVLLKGRRFAIHPLAGGSYGCTDLGVAP